MDENDDDTTQVLNLGLCAAPKVLLVDDDELVLERLRSLVTAAGFEVETAPDASGALASLKERFTPIVIMDRNMPGMDGLALCRLIRQQEWPGYIYILLLTVQDAEEDILTGLDAGADDYLSKRSSSAQLLARLRTARRILTLEHSLKIAVEEKRRLSLTDTLTGAPNRRYFLRHLSRELKRIHRTGGYLSLMSLDIDHFKRVNDQHGHAMLYCRSLCVESALVCSVTRTGARAWAGRNLWWCSDVLPWPAQAR
jgi:two-component system cell cycle response regulator